MITKIHYYIYLYIQYINVYIYMYIYNQLKVHFLDVFKFTYEPYFIIFSLHDNGATWPKPYC